LEDAVWEGCRYIWRVLYGIGWLLCKVK